MNSACQQIVPHKNQNNNKEQSDRPHQLAAALTGTLGMGRVLREGAVELGHIVGFVHFLTLRTAHLVYQFLQLLLTLITIDDARTILARLTG